AEPACHDVAGRELAACAVGVGGDAGEQAVGVGREASAEPADDPGEQRLADETAFAADDAPAHARLAGEADEALDLAHRHPAAGLVAGHAGQLHIDLLRGEVAARRAVDHAPLDAG